MPYRTIIPPDHFRLHGWEKYHRFTCLSLIAFLSNTDIESFVQLEVMWLSGIGCSKIPFFWLKKNRNLPSISLGGGLKAPKRIFEFDKVQGVLQPLKVWLLAAAALRVISCLSAWAGSSWIIYYFIFRVQIELRDFVFTHARDGHSQLLG